MTCKSTSCRDGSELPTDCTGHAFDPATGLYYYRHRIYHSQLGRFVSR
ncbi:MAG: RHS repeat-associated core domain-containing protein, partial [Planctomycetota bacterium]